jgi:superfamily II DNA/RNA helicase
VDSGRLPATLSEFQIVTAAQTKPHALVALLSQIIENCRRVIVFASSVDATHRLAVLLQSCSDALGYTIFELSSLVAAKKQSIVLERFKESATGCDIPAFDFRDVGIPQSVV